MAKGISLMTQLLSLVNYGDEKDINRVIAQTILKNWHKIPNMTIYELADLCYVSPSSITRFINSLDYLNFKLLKKDIQTSLEIDVDYSKNIHLATKDDIQPIIKRYSENVIKNINFMEQNMNYESLERVCRLIYEAKTIVFLGLEYANFVGFHFQTKMASLNKMILLGTTEEKQYQIVKSIPDNSLVFIASLEGSYFYRHSEIIDILVEKNCKIIALTMVLTGKFINVCDEVLTCGTINGDTEGRIALVYMIEVLLMNYYINYSHMNKIS